MKHQSKADQRCELRKATAKYISDGGQVRKFPDQVVVSCGLDDSEAAYLFNHFGIEVVSVSASE